MSKLKTPYKDLLPPLATVEFETLKADVKENGVINPIIVDEDGNILDGHHRYSLDKNAKRKVVKGLTDDEKQAFVIRANLNRRNLSPSQKKELLARQKQIAKDLREKDAKKWTQEKVASLLGVCQKTISNWFSDATNSNITIGCIPDARVKLGPKAEQEISERIEDGETQEQVAADFGVTRQSVAKVVKKRKKKKQVQQAKEVVFDNPNLDFRKGDFFEVLDDIEDGSVDLILTDPPYPASFLDCWDKLSEFASRKLKRGGFCIAYSGQLNIPEVFRRMTKHLDYYWMFSLIHSGRHQLVQPRNIFCGWKPILVFQNGFRRTDEGVEDVIKGSGDEKEYHEWQQSELELKPIIDAFSLPGQTIVEPFAGGGTTIVAALKMGRHVIASEIDGDSYKIASKRISEIGQDKKTVC